MPIRLLSHFLILAALLVLSGCFVSAKPGASQNQVASADGQGFEGGGNLQLRLDAAQTQIQATYLALTHETHPQNVCGVLCDSRNPACAAVQALSETERQGARDFLLSNADRYLAASNVRPQIVAQPLTVLDSQGQTQSVQAVASASLQSIKVYNGLSIEAFHALAHEFGHLISPLAGHLISPSSPILDYQSYTDFSESNGGYRLLEAVSWCTQQYFNTRVGLKAGDLDPTFNASGKLDLTIGLTSQVGAVEVQPDGKILVAGGYMTSSPKNSDWFVARINRDGTLDNGFGGGTGIAKVFFPNNAAMAAQVNAISVLTDGRIWLSGNATRGRTSSGLGVARLKADGSLDTTFAPQAVVGSSTYSTPGTAFYLDLTPGNIGAPIGTPIDLNLGTGHLLQPDGRLLLLASKGVRYLGTDGVEAETLSAAASFAGTTYFAGSATGVPLQAGTNLSAQPLLYQPVGAQLDALVSALPAAWANAHFEAGGAAVGPDGARYWLGQASSQAMLIRRGSNGGLVYFSAASASLALPSGNTGSTVAHAIVGSQMLAAGKYFVNGHQYAFVSRLDSESLAVDTSFGAQGTVALDTAQDMNAPSLALDNEGSVVVAGSYSQGGVYLRVLRAEAP